MWPERWRIPPGSEFEKGAFLQKRGTRLRKTILSKVNLLGGGKSESIFQRALAGGSLLLPARIKGHAPSPEEIPKEQEVLFILQEKREISKKEESTTTKGRNGKCSFGKPSERRVLQRGQEGASKG